MALPNETTPRPVSDEWYYSDGSQVHGPLSSRQLADLAVRGCIRRDYPVKKGNDGNWHLASEVKGLIFAPESQAKPGIKLAKASPLPLPARQEPTTRPSRQIEILQPACRITGERQSNSPRPSFCQILASSVPAPSVASTSSRQSRLALVAGIRLSHRSESTSPAVRPRAALPGHALPEMSRSTGPVEATPEQPSQIAWTDSPSLQSHVGYRGSGDRPLVVGHTSRPSHRHGRLLKRVRQTSHARGQGVH